MYKENGVRQNRNERHCKKKALCIATVASNLDNFNRSNVDILLGLGYEVTIAANFNTKEDINSQEKIDAFANEMRAKGVYVTHIDFTRKPGNLKLQWKSVCQVKKLLTCRFDLIHCHSPICAAIVRAEAERYRRMYGTKVFYTAHGFHFFTGAPIKNWLIFYPIERWMSRYTDVLITVNREDYKRSKRLLKFGKVYYIPGVGVEVKKFIRNDSDRLKKRQEFSIPEDAFVIVSVGEINRNKNHETIIRALAQIQKKDIHYILCGVGSQKKRLQLISRRLGIEEYIHFVGFRTDIVEILHSSDVFVFPSKREGLGLAALEGMASGLPLITSNVGGIRDYMINGKSGFCHGATDIKAFADSIKILYQDPDMRIRMGEFNKKNVQRFDIKNVSRVMKRIYMEK